jgi:hypothetical protein
MPGKLTFYPLINHNLFALKRHLTVSEIPKDQIMFIINTQDKAFEKAAIKYLEFEEVPYTVTESNGTAARGKNCFLDVFEASDSDYAVLIDGDDYLTPHGVYMYQMLANGSHPAPDAICLYNQVCFVPKHFDEVDIQADPDTEQDPQLVRFFTFEDWESVTSGDPIKQSLKEQGESLETEDSKYLINTYIELMKLVEKTVEANESHCRVTFISRNAIKYRFNEDFKVGEDTLNYLDLKNASMKGEITMCRTNELTPTYVYDMRVSAIAVPSCVDSSKYIKWAASFTKQILKYKELGRLHETPLPDLIIDYPKEYTSRFVGTEDFYFTLEFPTTEEGKTVKAVSAVPANASPNTVLENVVIKV